jgi:hypothetical protein
MAGGIDWFRWHHGSVTDPKFALIADKAKARLGDVLTVWAFILESASANQVRGRVGAIDVEALDFLLKAEPGTVQRIFVAMHERNVLCNEDGVACVARWHFRQPRREREPIPDATDPSLPKSSTQRSRERRERLKQEGAGNATQRDATPGNASNEQATPREEESREEKKREEIQEQPARAPRKPAADAAPTLTLACLVSEGVAQDHAAAWLRVRKEKRAPLTQVAWDDQKAQAMKAGITLDQAVHICAIKGWQAFNAGWKWQGIIDTGHATPRNANGGNEESPEQKAARREEGRRLAFGGKPAEVVDA